MLASLLAAALLVQTTHPAVAATGSDVTPPTISITYPAANRPLTNLAAITVSGKAQDNVAVASVYCQLNGTGWNLASLTNAGSNWTVEVTLRLGTNRVQAYASDTSGNLSATSSVSFLDVATAPLLVQTNGRGSVSPGYNGKWLEIGKRFTIAAKPAAGFAFANWIMATNGDWGAGQVVTNSALAFVMQTNLTLQANFKDVTKPTLLLTFPIANGRVTNSAAPVTIRGKAADNVQVTDVQYQLNGDPWAEAAPTINWSNWTAALIPPAGTNVIKAYALDAAGNRSPTNGVTFIYVVTSPLTLLTSGSGSITRNFSGNQLEVGRTYAVTALPGKGQIFSGWIGTVTSTNPVLRFLMQSNMVLQANFIPNPFGAAKGVYNGLFAQRKRKHKHSGFFTLTLTERGSYTASLRRGTNNYALSGQFDLTGQSSASVKVGTNTWVVTMLLDLAGAEQLAGSVSDPQWVAPLTALRAVFNAQTNPATQYAGKYTLVIPGTNGDVSLPEGDGYGAVSVDAGGKLALGGSLADGTPLSQSVAISRNGQWPLYVSQSDGRGSVWGWLTFDTNQPSASVAGELSWIKTAPSAARLYSAGFTNKTLATGARYTAPASATNRVIALTNGVVTFEGGNLIAPLTNLVTLTVSNKITDVSLTHQLQLSLNLSNGLFSGSVKLPGLAVGSSFKGALLQDLNSGFGYFPGTNRSGQVLLGSP